MKEFRGDIFTSFPTKTALKSSNNRLKNESLHIAVIYKKK